MKPAKTSRSTGEERRNFPRKLCSIEAELTADGYASGMKVRVTDVALGGCYVEMISPAPKGSQVELSMKLDEQTVRFFGKVRSAQHGFGMGVGFTTMNARDFEILRKFVPAGASSAEAFFNSLTGGTSTTADAAAALAPPSEDAQPKIATATEPNAPPRAGEALEALIRILCRKGLLTREEILAEVEEIRGSRM